MNGVSWWLMLLSFLLGALITWFWMIRRVTREVPVSREVRAGGSLAAGAGLGAGAAAVGAGALALDGDADADVDVDVPSVAADLDADLPSVDADLDVPFVGGDLDVDVPSLDGDLDADLPSLDGDLDADLPSVDADLGSAGVGLGAAGVGLGAAALGSPDADVDLPSLDADLDVPSVVGDPDADVPSLDGDLDVPAVNADLDAEGEQLTLGGDLDVDVPAVSGDAAGVGLLGAAAGAVSAAGSGKFGKGSATPAADGSGPAGWLVKGNEDSGLYHSPESPWYGRTKAEVWFETDEAAEAAGFISWRTRLRKAGAAKAAGDAAAASALVSAEASDYVSAAHAESSAADAGAAADATTDDVAAFASVAGSGKFGKGSATPAADGSGPAGWLVKGNEDSGLYHSPESPWYGRTKAEVWFETDEAAEAAGFISWRTRVRKAGAAKAAAPAARTVKATSTKAAPKGRATKASKTAKPVKSGVAFVAVPEGKFGKGSADPNPDGSGPAGWTIKGNEDSNLYHSPESPWYGRTIAEVWFETEEAAEGAGFVSWRTRTRKAGADKAGAAAFVAVPEGKFGKGSADPNPDGSGPAGWTIKGNEDSNLYHSPESPWYGRTIAEVWFETEEAAEGAGFVSWRTRTKK